MSGNLNPAPPFVSWKRGGWPRSMLAWGIGSMVAALAVCSAAPASPLEAQSVVGRLVDRESGEPIAGAAVTLVAPDSSTAAIALSDTAGAFLLAPAQDGTYLLTARRLGYATFTISNVQLEEGKQFAFEIALASEAVLLDGVTAAVIAERRPGELGGFYDRQRRNVSGKFITREEFADWDPSRFTNILAMNGIRLSARLQPVLRANCIRYVVDGVRLDPTFVDGGIDNMVNTRDVEAVEIYQTPADVPIEYAGGFNECGAIFIWTRYSR